MKRCPECDSIFRDGNQFCDLDGTPLVAADLDNQDAQQLKKVAPTEVPRLSRSNSKTLAILTVAGVAFAVTLFLIYHSTTQPSATENTNVSSTNSGMIEPPPPLVPTGPSPDASASPSPEPSPSPSVSPSPARQDKAARVELSPGTVSTSGVGNKGGPVIIRLTDGSGIEADEVWQTGEGIWYRKGGVVTMLDPKNVKAFEKPASSPSQPSTSTSPTP